MSEENERFELPPEEAPRETPQPEPPLPPPESTGIAWGLVVVLIGLTLVVVFTLQNTDTVPVRFLWWAGQNSLALVIVVTVAVTALITQIVDLIYRRRRRQRVAEREELRRLRRGG